MTTQMTLAFPLPDAFGGGRLIEEQDLVRRVRRGDQAAFRELVERYQRRVYSVIHGILRNHEDTEDTAQQVFTKVYFAMSSFDCRCSLSSWISKIAINESYSHLRKHRQRRALEADAPEYEAFAGESPFGGGLGPAADSAAATRDYLNKLLERVPEEQRLLLILKEVEGHSISELAGMTGLSASAIKTKLFRARRKLIEAAGRMTPDRVSL